MAERVLIVSASGGTNQIILAWDDVGADSYNVYYGTTAGLGTGGTKLTGVTSPYTHSSLADDQRYYYTVEAVFAGVPQDLSPEVSAFSSAVVVNVPTDFSNHRNPVSRTSVDIRSLVEKLDPDRHAPTKEYEFSNGRVFKREQG